MELGETMADNLVAKGVTASASDGLTTLANKILDIQTGGSCYHIEFSEASYTAIGGSATLEIYLQESYAPKSGASVTVTGSDGSVYNGITNSQGIASVTVSNVSTATTFTASYSNVTDTCTVTVGPSYLFYDSGVTGTKNTNFICTKTTGNYTLTTDSTGTTFVCKGSDGFYIPNIDLHSYSDLEITWTFTYGTRYACHLSLLNSNKQNSNNMRWHNSGTSTPTATWYNPSGQITINHTLTSGDTMKLIKSNGTFTLYCNGESLGSCTPNYEVYYIGLTSADNNRPFGYKELKIVEAL